MLSPIKGRDQFMLVGASHSGRDVFRLTNALRYFNQYTILIEELELGEKNQFYLEEDNLCYAAEKILDVQSEKLECYSVRGCDEDPRVEETAIRQLMLRSCKTEDETGGHDQLAQNISEALLDSDDSVIVSLPPTPVKEMPPDQSRSSAAPDLVNNLGKDELNTQPTCPHIDLSSLLRLMSIVPEPAASHCKRLMDRDQLSWKVSLYDVLIVFLNWGATLQSLGLEDVFDSSCSILSPEMPCPFSVEDSSKVKCPGPRNVYLVLSVVSERLPPNAAMPLHERTLLLRLLVHAATDRLQRCRLYHWVRCVQAVVDSISDWTEQKAGWIVSQLHLAPLGAETAVFLVCSVFYLASSRLNMLGLLAGHHVLAELYQFPPEISLSSVAGSLQQRTPTQLLDRFQLCDVYFITSLVHSLLIRHMARIPTPSQEVVDSIHQWTMELRDTLKKAPFMYNLVSGALRERLSRLTSECRSAQRRGRPSPTGVDLALNSVENSPCK